MKKLLFLLFLSLSLDAYAMRDSRGAEEMIGIEDQDTTDQYSSEEEVDKEKALCEAIKELDVKKVKTLLRKGANPNAVDEEGKCALTQALEVRDKELSHSQLACRSRNRNRILQLLCDAGADAKKKDSSGVAAIDKLRSSKSSLKRIFAEEKTIHERLLNLIASEPEGIEKGAPKRLKDLIDLGANVNVSDENGVTALMWAMIHGWTHVVTLLLKAPAIDTKRVDNKGGTALMWGTVSGHTDCIKLLLDKDASNLEMKNEFGNTALLIAAWGADVSAVELLLSRGADTRAQNNQGCTALVNACCPTKEWYYGDIHRLEVVRMLLKKDHSLLDLEDARGNTPLIWACDSGYDAIVELLLDSHADVSKSDRALRCALDKSHKNVVKMLLKKGALDVRALENYATEKHPARLARKKGLFDIEELIKAYIFINKVDAQLMTPLHFSAQRGENLRHMLDMGARIDARNKDGMTPLMLAAQKGHKDCVAELIKRGASTTYVTSQGKKLLDVAKPELIPFIAEQLAMRDQEKAKKISQQKTELQNSNPKKRKKLLPEDVHVPTQKKQAVTPGPLPPAPTPMGNSGGRLVPLGQAKPQPATPKPSASALIGNSGSGGKLVPVAKPQAAMPQIPKPATSKTPGLPVIKAGAPIGQKAAGQNTSPVCPFCSKVHFQVNRNEIATGQAGVLTPRTALAASPAQVCAKTVVSDARLKTDSQAARPMSAMPAKAAALSTPFWGVPLQSDETLVVPNDRLLAPWEMNIPVMDQKPAVEARTFKQNAMQAEGVHEPQPGVKQEVLENISEKPLEDMPMDDFHTMLEQELDALPLVEDTHSKQEYERPMEPTIAEALQSVKGLGKIQVLESNKSEAQAQTKSARFVIMLLERVAKEQSSIPALRVIQLFVEGLLIDAIKKNDLATARELLSLKVNCNIKTESGSLLHDAVNAGSFAMVDLLLKHGAQINARDQHEKTPLMMAAAGHDTGIIDLLLQQGADTTITDDQGRTALMLAALHQGELNKVEIMSSLCNTLSLLNVQDKGGKTIIDYVSAETLKAFMARVLPSLLNTAQEKVAVSL